MSSAQGGFVEHPGRFLHLVQLPTVDGQPPTIRGGLDLVGHQDVTVQLRIPGPRRPVHEHRSQVSAGGFLDGSAVAAATEAGVILQELQRRGDRRVVAFADLIGDLG